MLLSLLSLLQAQGASHHCDELLVVDLAIAVSVNTLKKLLDLLISEREVIAR